MHPSLTVEAPTRVVTTSCVTAPMAAPKICGLINPPTPPTGTTAIATHDSRRGVRSGGDFNAAMWGGGRPHGRHARVEDELSL